MHQILLAYLFICFSIGLVCIGSIISVVHRSCSSVAWKFLAFYSFLTISVLTGLLLSFLDVASGTPGTETRAVLEYLESMVSFYGMMFTFPLFAHSALGVDKPRRDRILLAIVGVAFIVQHVTEYGLGGRWDSQGDLLENLLFAAIGTYLLAIWLRRITESRVDRTLPVGVLVLFILGATAVLHDLFLIDTTGLRFYPLLFAISSIVIAWHIYCRSSQPLAPSIPLEWNLTERESEVVDCVLAGLSNKEIGSKLHISINTVKTHLRTVFEKSGCHSRFELMAAVASSHRWSAGMVVKTS